MRTKKSKTKLFLALTIAALLPLSLYFIFSKYGGGGVKKPQYYRVKSIESKTENGEKITDTIYHQINDLVLTNQLGKQISINDDLKGKVLVIDFMFTSCKSICPVLSRSMRQLQDAYKKKKPDWVQFISISVDPNDSVPVLRAYADNFGANHDRWWFLTGNQEQIFNFAKNELGVLLQPADGSDGFDHSENLILIDPDRYIRGYYNGTIDKEVAQLANDIAVLKLEKKR